jgi:type II secretion system (T2SS) protein C
VKRRLLLLVDALLLVVAAFLGVRLYEAWALRAPAPPTEPASSPSAEVAAPPAAVAPTPPLTAFNVVAERNLFSPTRSETAPEPTRAGGGPAAAAPPAPKPRLYGVVILAEGRDRAYLEDMQRRKVFAYSVGDLVGDARLEQIKSDRVVLRRGGETFEVLLNDPSKPRQNTPPSGVQSSEAGGVVRPGLPRPPVPRPPIGGIRAPGRPRVPTPVPAPPPPSSEGQESPAEEE